MIQENTYMNVPDKLHQDNPRNHSKKYMWNHYTMKSGKVVQVTGYRTANAIQVTFEGSDKKVFATVKQLLAGTIKEPKR